MFVIIAVVIFGIFVSISYIVFKDTMGTSLTAIFNESTSLDVFNNYLNLEDFEQSVRFKEYLTLEKKGYGNQYSIKGFLSAGQEYLISELDLTKGKTYQINISYKTETPFEEINLGYDNTRGLNLFVYNKIPDWNDINNGTPYRVQFSSEPTSGFVRYSLEYTHEKEEAYLVLTFAGIADKQNISVSFKDLYLKEANEK